MSNEREIHELRSEINALLTRIQQLENQEQPSKQMLRPMNPLLTGSGHPPLDGHQADADVDPIRKTIEPNPEANNRKGRLQLVNADQAVVSAKSLFHLPLDASGSGDLIPAVTDADAFYQPFGESIEILPATSPPPPGVATPAVLEVKNFLNGTAAPDPLTSGTLVFVRDPTGGYNSKPTTVYATPAQIVNAGGGYSGNPGGNAPDHADLGDIVNQSVGDDHRGNRTAASGISGYHPYIHCNGDATRNAMETGSRIGDHLGAAAIDPDGRTLNSTWSVDSGHFAVKAGYTYIHDTHYGKSHATKIALTDANGNAVECYLRGGILCED